MTDPQWAALVEAERERVGLAASFYQQAPARPEIIAAALASADGWKRRTALMFLAELSDDVPVVLDQLIDLALSHGWAGYAREAMTGAWRSGRVDDLPARVLARLDDADDDEYRRLAELLDHLRAWDALSSLVERARTSPDPAIREVAGDFDG